MKRISAKMKLLSLAILGLGGMAMAGSAAAACPTSPVPPWSSQHAVNTGSLAISATGLDGSSCKLDAKIAGLGLLSAAYVQDDSPSAEPHYRAQFLVDTSNLTNFSFGDTFVLFSAKSTGIVNSNNQLVRVTITAPGLAGGAPVVSFASACTTAQFGLCSVGSLSLPSGVNRIEIEWIKGSGADGVARVWLNNTNEASPNLAVSNLVNAAFVGVDSAALGIASPTNSFMTAHANQLVSVDTFDSRRSTFIGN
jgi:hypothetical protein